MMQATPSDLLQRVQAELLPSVARQGFEIIDSEHSDSFDNASVTMRSGDVRMRIVRERSQLFVDFGSAAKPEEWFDSAVVVDYLGIARDGGFHSSDELSVLRGLASLLEAFWADIEPRFGRAAFPEVEQQLIALREARAAARFGY